MSEVEVASRRVIAVRVDSISMDDAVLLIGDWARHRTSAYVCACNVHMVMEAHDDPQFADIVNGAALVTSDGMPVVWALRMLGERGAERVYGPELMLRTCGAAARSDLPIGLYGGTPHVLAELQARLTSLFPDIRIAYAHSPPFSDVVDERELGRIRDSGARILFVALGCPKQERWMSEHFTRMELPMIGVGAAFDFISGSKPQAPRLLQATGLEWAFRLATEPRRLWRRYAFHNPRFVSLLARQLLMPGQDVEPRSERTR